MSREHGEVVLLSAQPDAHQLMVRTLRRRGVRVRIPGTRAPLRVLGGTPDLILVDLVHGAGLTREMVATLNRRRGQAIVVALHEGSLAPAPDATADLVVEGFCRCTDWWRLLGALTGRADTGDSQLH